MYCTCLCKESNNLILFISKLLWCLLHGDCLTNLNLFYFVMKYHIQWLNLFVHQFKEATINYCIEIATTNALYPNRCKKIKIKTQAIKVIFHVNMNLTVDLKSDIFSFQKCDWQLLCHVSQQFHLQCKQTNCLLLWFQLAFSLHSVSFLLTATFLLLYRAQGHYTAPICSWKPKSWKAQLLCFQLCMKEFIHI